jgi:hypothetical protein
MRAIRFFFPLSAFTLFFAALALAQSSETGLPPFGSFNGSNFDLVSLKSGNLHVEIPCGACLSVRRPIPGFGLSMTCLHGKWINPIPLPAQRSGQSLLSAVKRSTGTIFLTPSVPGVQNTTLSPRHAFGLLLMVVSHSNTMSM